MPYRDPEKKREANRAWTAAHPEVARDANQKWRAANRERVRESQRGRSRRWRAAHPDKVQERVSHPRLSMGNERVMIHCLPPELQPVALLIREARSKTRSRKA